MDRHKKIGLLIQDFDSEYARDIIKGAVSFCDENKISLYIFLSNCPKERYSNGFYFQYWNINKSISENTVDALVVTTGTLTHFVTNDEFAEILKRFGKIPIISIGHGFDFTYNLIVDEKPGFKAIILHLVTKHNCKKIAVMGTKLDSKEDNERYKICKETLKELDVEFDESLYFEGSYSYLSGRTILSRKYKCKEEINFDALIAFNDDMAFGCIEYLNEIGVSVPDDVIVTGFDDSAKSKYSTPTLTTVDQQISMQGYEACQMAFDVLCGKNIPKTKVIETKEKLRQSCGCISMDDFYTNSINRNGEKEAFTNDNNSKCTLDWLLLKNQLVNIKHYIGAVEAEINFFQLAERLKYDLKSFDISHAAICLYPEPVYCDRNEEVNLPVNMRLFLGYTPEKEYFVKDNIIFNPHEIFVPCGIFDGYEGSIFVIQIFHNYLNYGYIVFSQGFYDNVIYETICITMSRMIASSFAFTKKEMLQNHLREKNKNLIKDNESLEEKSNTDEMTKLCNRRGLMKFGQPLMDKTVSKEKAGYVFFADMDGLKYINDNFGHAAGDEAIKAIADILKKVFRGGDIVARLGGDEFVIITSDISFDILDNIRKRISDLCNEWNVENNRFKLSISIGATIYNIENYNLEKILLLADELLYEEKKSKKQQKNAL